MQFRYDFGEKLDLSKFRKQAKHYSKYQSEYLLVLGEFLLIANFESNNRVQLTAFDITKDADGNISKKKFIFLAEDNRFQEFKDVRYFTENNSAHPFTIEKQVDAETIDRICNLIKVFHKVNGLKAFL